MPGGHRLLPFFGRCFGLRRLALCPKRFFLAFTPPLDFLLSFAHGVVLLSPMVCFLRLDTISEMEGFVNNRMSHRPDAFSPLRRAHENDLFIPKKQEKPKICHK